MRKRVLRIAVMALLGILGIAHSGIAADTHLDRVLVLSADPHISPGLTDLELSLRRVVSEQVPWNVEMDVEHLDLVFAHSSKYRQTIVTFIAEKYADRRPDIVLAIGTAALGFTLEERERLFPGARIVFAMVQRSDLAGLTLPKDAVGVVTDYEWEREADLALQLLPATRRIVMILGSGPLEQKYEPIIRDRFTRFAGRVEVQWWVGVPVPDLEKRVASLPEHTVVVYVGIYRDNAGDSYVPMIVAQRLARLAKAPIFGSPATWLGTGIVGDGRFNLAIIGRQLGETIVRLLRGERPESIGTLVAQPGPQTFDARQLDRWEIDRRLLPKGSIVRFDAPSLWEQHRWTLLIGLSVILLQAVLLVALVTQRLARRRAERERSESRRMHASLVDSLDVRIATIARDGTIIAANRAWLDFAESHGNTVALGVGGNYLDFVKDAIARGQKDALRTMDSLLAVLEGRETSARVEYFSPEQGEAWRYEMRIVALDAEETGAIVTIQDVTDRWQSEERVRVALEALPVATVLVDTDGRIELVNAEAERLFGYSREELLGHWISVLVPDSSRKLHERLQNEYLKHPDAHVVGTGNGITGRRKDGREIALDVHLRPIDMSARKLVLASIFDITERRRIDSEMQKLREETAHFGRVAAVGEMSGAIAHELNQPLTGILTNSQAALRSLERGGYSKDDLVETLNDIVADTRRAGEVILRLRVMLRKGVVETQPVDVNDMVKQVVRLVSYDLNLRSATLDLELTDAVPRIIGDRIHLQQVVLNLILNGADAMTEVPVAQRRLLLRTAPGINRTVKLELRDRGPGISDEAMPHMFEPFFTTKVHGMGMGLSIVRSIVESHGGSITCANAASGGAVFTVTLPSESDGDPR